MTKHNATTVTSKPRVLPAVAHEELSAVQAGQSFLWRSAAHGDSEGSPDGSTFGA